MPKKNNNNVFTASVINVSTPHTYYFSWALNFFSYTWTHFQHICIWYLNWKIFKCSVYSLIYLLQAASIEIQNIFNEAYRVSEARTWLVMAFFPFCVLWICWWEVLNISVSICYKYGYERLGCNASLRVLTRTWSVTQMLTFCFRTNVVWKTQSE